MISTVALGMLLRLCCSAPFMGGHREQQLTRHVILECIESGHVDGTIETWNELMPNGGVRRRSILRWGRPVQQSTVLSDYDNRGRPIRMELRRSPGSVSISYGPTYATQVLSWNGEKQTSQLKYPKGATPGRSGIIWFLRKKPKIGASCSFLEYDLMSSKIALRKMEYVGDVHVAIGATRNVQAHLVEFSDGGAAWLDDEGLPFKETVGRLTYIRIGHRGQALKQLKEVFPGLLGN